MRTLKCVGVIFQLSEEGVLFEFSTGGRDDAVGIIRPVDIIVKDGGTIPETASSTDLLSKYIQVGDELLCQVSGFILF
jgi:hypothetical protein